MSNTHYQTRYAVCVQTTAFCGPTRVSEKIFKTFGAANRAFSKLTAGMPYHQQIKYSVLGARFCRKYNTQHTGWG